MQIPPRSLIGRNALISVGGIDAIPAKVDTGADSSAIWTSAIHERDGELHFTLFDPVSEYYTGEEIVAYEGSYKRVWVTSSSGAHQRRYAVTLPVIADGRPLEAIFTLADRWTMTYPVLLGRNFLAGQFLVDVSRQIPDEVEQALRRQRFTRRKSVKE